MNRVPLPPSRTPLKRTRLARFSAKRLAQAPARRRCVAEVVARDGGCVFPALVDAALASSVLGDFIRTHPWQAPFVARIIGHGCSGPLTAHELAHSRNVGRLNPAASVAACWYHNGVAEDMPEFCRAIGFAAKGNGLPLSHVEVQR